MSSSSSSHSSGDHRRGGGGNHPSDHRSSHKDRRSNNDGSGQRYGSSSSSSSGRSGGGSGSGSGRHQQVATDGRIGASSSHHAVPQNYYKPTAPSTGEFRSGHIEVGSLYGGGGGGMVVNSMNAPNNSTMQCGCENIDCPFCNLTMSIQMSGGGETGQY